MTQKQTLTEKCLEFFLRFGRTRPCLGQFNQNRKDDGDIQFYNASHKKLNFIKLMKNIGYVFAYYIVVKSIDKFLKAKETFLNCNLFAILIFFFFYH